MQMVSPELYPVQLVVSVCWFGQVNGMMEAFMTIHNRES
jgi:hypothetical protein